MKKYKTLTFLIDDKSEESKRIADDVIIGIRSAYYDRYGEEVVQVIDEVYN